MVSVLQSLRLPELLYMQEACTRFFPISHRYVTKSMSDILQMSLHYFLLVDKDKK